MAEARYQIEPRVAFQQVEEGYFVITSDNQLHQLKDDVAVVLWELLDRGPQPLSSLVQSIVHEFDVETAVANRDVQEWLEKCLMKGLISVGG